MKPILFSTEMVRAILDNRKSQTRRVVKTPGGNPVGVKLPEMGFAFGGKIIGEPGNKDNPYGFMTPLGIVRPQYDISDILYVRETWAAQHSYDHLPPRLIPSYPAMQFHYAATEERGGLLWRPSIFMPRHVARIFLKVVNIRVERLQEISESDAGAEGLRIGIGGLPYFSCRDAYAGLWNSIYAKRNGGIYAWESNPWVWIYEFKRHFINQQ